MCPSPISVPDLGDDGVAGQRDLQAAGDGVAVQHRDDGQRAALDAPGEVGDGAQERHR